VGKVARIRDLPADLPRLAGPLRREVDLFPSDTPVRRRIEVSSYGVDDGLVGFSSSPFPNNAYPEGPGLRIPPVWPNFIPPDTGPQTRPRFLFCLATRLVRAGTILRGIRQGLTIGVDANHNLQEGFSGVPERPVELDVTTPSWRFVDGNVSWHLVFERDADVVGGNSASPANQLTNSANFLWEQSQGGAAMLYETFTNSETTATGAPLLYMRGLESYTPPELTKNWFPLDGDLFSFYDIRYPWKNASSPAYNLEIPLKTHGRVSLYASVLQSNPDLRTSADIDASAPPPEEQFVADYTEVLEGKGTDGPIYWRVFGSLIFEDAV